MVFLKFGVGTLGKGREISKKREGLVFFYFYENFTVIEVLSDLNLS